MDTRESSRVAAKQQAFLLAIKCETEYRCMYMYISPKKYVVTSKKYVLHKQMECIWKQIGLCVG